MKKIIIIISLFIIAATSILFYFAVNENFETIQKNNYASKIYETDSGFGYLITSNNKVIIKQDVIPSIQKNQSFCTFKDANNAANLVLEKLIQKQNPSISLQDLKKMNITTDCN